MIYGGNSVVEGVIDKKPLAEKCLIAGDMVTCTTQPPTLNNAQMAYLFSVPDDFCLASNKIE